jgi:hypothetical protein
VAGVGLASTSTGNRKWLAWAAPGPDRPQRRPAGEREDEGPAADPGEEVALPVSIQVGRSNIDN